jgi:PAS domain S-box-containing protein
MKYLQDYIFRMWLFAQNKWEQLIRSGLNGDEEIMDARRIILTNFGALINFVFLGGFGIYLIFSRIPYACIACFIGSAFNLQAYILTSQRKFSTGYLEMSLGNLLIYILFSILYGRYSGGYLLLLAWLISIVTLSKNKRTSSLLFLIGALSFLGIEYYTLNFQPIVSVSSDFHYLYYIIASLCLLFVFGVVQFFIKVQVGFQKELEEKNAQLNRYFTAMEQTHSTIVITDNKGTIIYANPAFEKTTNYTVNEALGKNPRILKSSKTPENVYHQLWNTINNGEVWSGEFINRKKTGEEYFERATISPIKNSLKEIINFVAVKEDITELKKADIALKLSETRLAKLLETQTVKNRLLSKQLQYIYNNSINAVAFFELSGESIRFSSCNKRWAKAIGFEVMDVEGEDITSLLDVETVELYKSFIRKSVAKQAPLQEYLLYRDWYLYVIVTPILDEQTGQYTSCASFIYNVTDKYMAELKMQESEEKFFTIFNNSTDAMALLTYDFRVIEANRKIGSLLGYTPRKSDYTSPPIDFTNYIPAKYHREIWSRFKKVQQGESLPSFECEIRHANGTILPVEMDSSIITLNGSSMLLCIIRDISARKNLERKLTQVGIQIENRERRKLATDLHDNVGPLLSSLSMCLSMLSRKPGMQEHTTDISDIRHILKESITSVREISNNISPQVLNNYGLASALEVFFETKRKLINIQFTHNIPDLRFSEIKEVMIYNIVKEAFNNSIKYSKASLVQLNINLHENIITVSYLDNGIGFNLDEKLALAGSSLGLFSIINRIRNLDGEHSINTSPGHGFNLEVTFSINEDKYI